MAGITPPLPKSMPRLLLVTALAFLCAAAKPVLGATPVDLLEATSDLLTAAQSGDFSAADRALRAGAKPEDARDENGNNALHWAAWHGHAAIVTLLLEGGALVDATDGPNDGNTALMKAAWNAHDPRHVATVEALLRKGADIEAKNVYGMTALMNAAMSGRADVVRALLKGRADPKVGDQGGVTALHKAAYKGYNDVCEALVDAGADINQPRHDGITPIMLAESEKKMGTVALLKAKGAETPKMERMPDVEYNSNAEL
jgi:ankyrin repeat protein